MDEKNLSCLEGLDNQPIAHIFIAHRTHHTLYKIVKHFAQYSTDFRVQNNLPRLHIQQWHQWDYLSTQHCPFTKCRYISHVRSFSSCHRPRILFSISSIVTVDWCYISVPLRLPPAGKHTEELNNFSIYMHEGTRYHSNTLGHLRKCTASPERQRCGLGFPLAVSLSALDNL